MQRNNMTNETRTLTREDIERKHETKGKRLVTVMAGLGLALFFYAFAGRTKDPYKNKPDVIAYNDASQSLLILSSQKSEISKEAIPYRTDELRPYLDSIFEEESVKASSLEKAVKIVESDIRNFERNSDEVRDYLRERENRQGRKLLFALSGFGIFIASLLRYGFICSDDYGNVSNYVRKKTDAELKAL